jgi:hypothetical protein
VAEVSIQEGLILALFAIALIWTFWSATRGGGC